MLLPYVNRTRIAYLSMELALRPEIHTYSGGLGILAGDTARSAADLALPMVFVTLATRQGYLRQEIDGEGRQIDHPDPWRLAEWATPVDAMVAVPIEGRVVWVRPWVYLLDSPIGHPVPVLLLDCDLDQNAPEDRAITDSLYGGDAAYRLKQEVVLGIGGGRVLEALGFAIDTFHMNEGHAALLTLHLLRRHPRPNGEGRLPYDVEAVRNRCVFTTHTPVEAGHDRFDYELVERVLGADFFDLADLRRLGGEERLNMTRLALNLSGFVNGVARRHAETTRRLFPGYRIAAITNGVHAATWTHPAFARLFETVVPHWAHEPELLGRAEQLEDDAVWAAHETAKAELLALVEARSGHRLRPELPLVGFARRVTGYKRADLLFTDLERLRALARRWPFQIVLAGKAHPHDGQGKALIAELHRHARTLGDDLPVVFLPGYDMAMARALVSGVDIWLNTPLPPLEASGTSGMKAALNGVLNLSVLDGWWLEACVEDVTGWAIGLDGEGSPGDHAEALYAKLEERCLPLWHQDRPRWVWSMKQAIAKIGATFNSQRMMRRYASEAYLR